MDHPLLDLSDHLAALPGLPPAAAEKRASALHASAAALEHLPDHLFGLVGTLDGLPFRKFAMHDAAHFTLNTLYFLQSRQALAPEVQQKVARNLYGASAWYDVPELEKAGALGALLTLSGAPDKVRAARQQNATAMDSFRAAQASGLKTAGLQVTANAEEARRGAGGAFRVIDRVVAHHNGAGELSRLLDGDTSMLLRDKTASWAPCGEISFVAPPAVSPVTHFALPEAALYPLETAQHVKTAAAYFTEHASSFSLEERREFSVNLAQRAEELGVKVAGAHQAYTGEGYGAYLRFELDSRIRNYAGTNKVASYQVLKENISEVAPEVMVELLKVADKETGASACYGRSITGFRDPYRAVYEKRASKAEAYTWASEGHHITADTLASYARKSPRLDDVFGEGFSLRFAKDPVAVFRGLEESKKVLFARLANYDTTH